MGRADAYPVGSPSPAQHPILPHSATRVLPPLTARPANGCSRGWPTITRSEDLTVSQSWPRRRWQKLFGERQVLQNIGAVAVLGVRGQTRNHSFYG